MIEGIVYRLKPKDFVNIGRAFDAALLSDHRRCRHGAIVVKASRKSIGFNRVKNNPRYVEENWTIHAECDAIKKASHTAGATCYSVRIDLVGNSGYAKPCVNCFKVLKDAGVRKVIYSSPDSPTGFRLLKV